MEANERRRIGRRMVTVAKEKEEDERATEEATGGSRICTERSAPFDDGRRETPRKLVVPIGDEECGLRGAERDYLPRSRRRVAQAGAWLSPEQG
ncbi:hypothetical protein NDU88_003638 [Pleurodeles waltl]|uniref:Uncharacterized protein n=1 Tax=Pleurodeles waltl TaxID=8319 RepID=A0AAV7N0P8_PLEWA|nr:hypothetical protein NDU88_003638 [Pleurodeles waltl]